MGSDYKPVTAAMAAGTPLDLICGTCPWDRLCVNPPTMTSAEIDRRVADAQRADEARAPDGMPTQTLMTAMVYAGRDTAGDLCPVLAARLRSPDGRGVADAVKTLMQAAT